MIMADHSCQGYTQISKLVVKVDVPHPLVKGYKEKLKKIGIKRN